ncbi:ATP-binding cassette sub- F member 3 [Desmophyllum pertusum]|uniref:Integral membrane protein 2 n=1 Tax=Desmophyllum pertusum TaxID=174260 RepID=A0A9X0CGS5_9CNID|nr:ATP-binding cassette sub- F member 3 [Desmophyllum pertusum]
MVYFFIVTVVLLSSTSGGPVYKSDERTEDFSPKEVVDFNVDISEAGQEYIERIEVDEDKQTELFQVPAHPGVDRSDVLNDFKQRLTMLRFLDSKICYLFPLASHQSTPKKLIRDLEMAKQIVITETRRVDTTWLIDGEMTNRSVLSEELADFCAMYPIYQVKETRGSVKVTESEPEERANRRRRRIRTSPIGKSLCPGGMDLNTAQQICPEPEKRCQEKGSCYNYVLCGNSRRGRAKRCQNRHGVSKITCCKYICLNFDASREESGDGPGDVPGDDPGDRSGDGPGDRPGSGDTGVLERL